MKNVENHNSRRTPWNKGKLVGQKPALKMKEVWGIRIHLQLKKKVILHEGKRPFLTRAGF